MREFLILRHSGSDRLRAKGLWFEGPVIPVPCPADSSHVLRRGPTRPDLAPLDVELKHNDRNEVMVWTYARMRLSCLVHDSLATRMVSRGLTGFAFRPATLRFRDGVLTREYAQLIVTGWGGIARPESGIRLIENCPACFHKVYSPVRDASQLVDVAEWTGEDFFKVWPLAGYILITERVAEFLASAKIRSYALIDPCDMEWENNFEVGGLDEIFPEELAVKYGRPLGIA